MISEKLHAAIDRWARVSTWHTNHSSDDERFYELLQVAETDGPENFYADQFEEITGELIRRHNPKLSQDFLEENLLSRVLAAEQIMGYLAHCHRHAA